MSGIYLRDPFNFRSKTTSNFLHTVAPISEKSKKSIKTFEMIKEETATKPIKKINVIKDVNRSKADHKSQPVITHEQAPEQHKKILKQDATGQAKKSGMKSGSKSSGGKPSLKNNSTIAKTPTKKTPPKSPQKSTKKSSKSISIAKKNWQVPAHSGVPLVVSKTPVRKLGGVTKPASAKKLKKLPAHSGVPVSFKKGRFLMTAIDK